MTFPFHCMQTGIRSEATQGNTLRCRVPLDVGDATMIATLRPQSPCGKARDGCRTMTLPVRRPPLNCRARRACARSAEAADPGLGKRMPKGVVEMPKKRRHRPPGERSELPEMAFSPLLQWACSSGKARRVNRDQRRELPLRGFHGPASLRSRRRWPALCGLVGFRDFCHGFAELPNPPLSVFLVVRTDNDLFGRRVAFGLADL